MKLIRFALLNFKKGIKDIKVLGLSFLMPIVVITAIFYGMMGGNKEEVGISYSDVAINVADNGELAQQMIKDLNINGSIYYNMPDKALEPLKKNDVKAVYFLPQDFTTKIRKGIKPEIKSYKNVEGNSTTPVEGVMEEWINNQVKFAVLQSAGVIQSPAELESSAVKTVTRGPENPVNQGQFLALLLIINFIIFSANGISAELLALKKEHILSRAVTTANKGYEIIGGVYLGAFLQQTIIYTVVYLIEKAFIGYSLANFPIVFLGIMLSSLVSISLGVLAVRIFENESVIALTVNLFAIITTFLGMAGMEGMAGSQSWIVQNLSRFTPQYWVLDAIDKSGMFPNCLILILMALVLFTAGNYRVRNFVNR